MIKTLIVTGLTFFAIAFAPAQALTLSNTNGGDGYVVTPSGRFAFTVYGSNNVVGESVAMYSGTATAAATFFYDYSYTTMDSAGAQYDAAGYMKNGVLFQVSPGASPPGITTSGDFWFSVAAGDTYGFYVSSTDSNYGRAWLSIAVPSSGAIPEPATWALLVTGFALVGTRARRRRAVALG